MDIQIRKAETTDASKISSLLRSLALFAHSNNEEPQVTEQCVLQHLALWIANDSYFVLIAQTASGEITGYCAVHWLANLILTGPEGYISELFIHDAFRGRGIGSQLLDAVQVEARSRGCSRLMLLNIRKRDSYQRQFYPKHGWEERPDAANFIFSLCGRT